MFRRRWRLFSSFVVVCGLAACSKKAAPLSHDGKAIYAIGRPAEHTMLEAHGDATCVVRKDGRHCWGFASYLQPTKYPREAVSVRASSTHQCMLEKTGTMLCLGDNAAGGLGNGEIGKVALDLAPVARMSEVTSFALAKDRSCALARTSEKSFVYCWGRVEIGDPRAYPERVGANIDDAREIAIEDHLSCVRRGNGTVWCWGRDTSGELGRGDEGMPWSMAKRKPSLEPVRVLHVDDAVGIGVGSDFACALTARGTVGCWGGNAFGQLGDDTVEPRSYASDVLGLSDVVQIAVGGLSHVCARKRDGTVWCWGRDASVVDITGPRFVNVYPQIRRTPQQVANLEGAIDIAAGDSHACARLSDGAVVCWGNNQNRQFGYGNPPAKSTPYEVFGLDAIPD